MTYTDEQIKALLALQNAATPGPWYHVQPFLSVPATNTIHGYVRGQRVDFVDCKPFPVHGPTILPMEGRECHTKSVDMAFIASAHDLANVVRQLLRERDDLIAELKRCQFTTHHEMQAVREKALREAQQIVAEKYGAFSKCSSAILALIGLDALGYKQEKLKCGN